MSEADRLDLCFHLWLVHCLCACVAELVWPGRPPSSRSVAILVIISFWIKPFNQNWLTHSVFGSLLPALPILTGQGQPENLLGEPGKKDASPSDTLPTCQLEIKLPCYIFWKIICWKVKKCLYFHSFLCIRNQRFREVSKLDHSLSGSS